MIAVYDFVPKFCPNCGVAINLQGYDEAWHYWRDADYHAGASHSCRGCNLHYQKATREAILDAARISDGDMHIYA